MKTTDKSMLVLVASLALLLTGCGGGSSSTPTTPVDPGPTPPDQLATANKIIMLHEEASGANADAEAAGMAAAQAVKDATRYSGMLDTASVMGDSTKAMMNAQMVLDARAAVTQAVTDTEVAKMRAMNAKTEAEALADGTSGKSEVIAALDAAIKAVEAELVTVTAISTGSNADYTNNADGLALMMAVEAVTGTAARLKTPDDIASGVAMAIADALAPTVPDTVADATTHDGAARSVSHHINAEDFFVDASPPAVAKRTFHGNNSLGRTWDMIVGEDNVMSERIGDNNAVRMVASVAGMTAADVNATVTATGGTRGTNAYADAFTRGGSSYKGILGDIFCLGDDCEVDSNGKLAGSWYFSPTNPGTYYILNPTAADRNTTLYVQDLAFISFGHWLIVAENGDVTVHTYAYPLSENVVTRSLRLGEDPGESAVNTATYSGEAVGMSVHKTFDGNGKQMGIHSGAFTADVSLTAKFGATPTLSGTVDNFQGGSHTDSGWSVALQETDLTTTSTVDGDGVAKGSGQAGDWTARGYGGDGLGTSAGPLRPTGFFGNFEAHFTDGHASGAYATRKD